MLTENSSQPEAGKSLEMSGQGRENPTIPCHPSGQGSIATDNPAGLSGQRSEPPPFQTRLRFAFKKPPVNDPIRTPSPTPISDPSSPCIMEETDGYDTPSLTRDLGLGNQSEPMNIRPKSDPETTDPDLGHHQNQPGEDQENEEVFYDCRSQSTEGVREIGR